MKTVNPDPQQLSASLAAVPADKPVVMVNLLKFRQTAAYKDGTAECPGKKAYGLYAQALLTILKEIGAEVVYLGKAHGSLIGPADEAWDEVLLVKYPSIGTFTAMIGSPAYKAVVKHRTAALEDSRLIATSPPA